MENIVYHSVQPSNSKTDGKYKSFDNVDFLLNFEGRKMLGNTLKISGRLIVNPTSGTAINNEQIMYDNGIGIHGAVENWVVSTDKQGQLEYLTEYGRYCGMVKDTTMTDDDCGANAENQVELRTYTFREARQRLIDADKPAVSGTNSYAPAYADDEDFYALSFSMRPQICLNTMTSDAGMPSVSYTKTGQIRVSMRVARATSFLHGSGMTGTVDFSLKDLRAEFISVPEDNVSVPVSMRVKSHIKQTILSENTSVSVKVPMVADAVSCSFQEQARENTLLYCNSNRAQLVDVSRCEFSFNSNSQELVSYLLEDRVDILRNYGRSFGDKDNNSMQLQMINANKAYGVGVEFEPTDLTNKSFTIALQSGVNSTNPYVMYCYFHGLMTL